MARATKDLIQLVERVAGEANSATSAQKLINQGADITARSQSGSMIDSITAEEKRWRHIIPRKADNCLRLIEVLKKAASDQLAAQVFAADDANFELMEELVKVRADCYQSTSYGPLGLLGSLLQQQDVAIELDVVQLLVESDLAARTALTAVDTQQQTCLSVAKTNSTCPVAVVEYIQRQLNELLYWSPFIEPKIDPKEVITWVQRGAQLEAIDPDGNTVLTNAVKANNFELVRILLFAGSNPEHRNNQNLTPLKIARGALPKNPPLIALLEAQSVNAELQNLIRTERSQLTAAQVQQLLERGADINNKISNGDSLLHLLIQNRGTPEMITIFVNDFNADLSATNHNGHRAIETCVLLDKNPYARLLTFFKLSRTITDTFSNTQLNKTLLEFAMENKRLEAAERIREDLNLRLWSCARRADHNDDNNKTIIEEMKQLVAVGAEMNFKHSDKEYAGWTVLHLACKTATDAFVQYLVEHGHADYMLTNSNGDYPISIAAEHGLLTIVQYLHILPNCNVNVVNNEKESPLHLATKNHHLRVVQYLVRWGADHQARTRAKQTPLQIAKSNRFASKEDEINGKKLIQFLEQLICPSASVASPSTASGEKSMHDVDMSELVVPIMIDPINMTINDVEGKLVERSTGLFTSSPNTVLHDAVKRGAVFEAKKAISQGADIRQKKGSQNPITVAQLAANDYTAKLNSRSVKDIDRPPLQMAAVGCMQIVDILRELAQEKLIESIDQSDAALLVSYHQAGALLTVDLIYRTCQTTDNVQIVNYLMNNDAQIYEAVMQDSSMKSPYYTARKNKFDNVANYLRYRLSVECAKAVTNNDLDKVQQLMQAGASVNMEGADNLGVALYHQNIPLIKLLCENGVMLPNEWLTEENLVLPSTLSSDLKSEMTLCIDRCLINRRLHLAAARGDLNDLIRCQRRGADIDWSNCYGSTALLYAIQYGNSFPVVHALVSCGASMLHTNNSEPMSLLDLAKKQNNREIANYLRKELNVQFLSAILSNDRASMEKFAQLGVDFNFQDEQQRTALHYAVQYQDADLVTWLCECGSSPYTPDINGDYPMMLAIERGNYPIVEVFINRYPATRKQKNKAGFTALALAQQLKFDRIAQLIETGISMTESEEGPGAKSDASTHSLETLMNAARKGQLKTIQEFIKERYESAVEKKRLCVELIREAEKAKQFQISQLLKQYQKTLRTDLSSDYTSPVMLNEHYRKILLGFLSGLSDIIANSSVVLDPTDPNTYVDLFAGLNASVAKRSQQLQDVNSEQDVKNLIDKDSAHSQEQLAAISEQLHELIENREQLEQRILDADARLHKQEKLTALQRKTMTEEREVYRKQMASYECSIFVFQQQQEATRIRQSTINFIKDSPNLIMFYRTIENRLEALFHSILAAQGGYVKRGNSTKQSNMRPTSIPFGHIVTMSVKTVLGPVLSKLDEKEQKREWQNISTLGNIEELNRIASDTAGLVTLYYREQIQSIDASQKIRGKNMFNIDINWIRDVLGNMRPENSEASPVVMVAEYVTAWIIEALKAGQREIIPTEPLPHQLWLYVAKKDPVDQRMMTSVVGTSAGRQRIPLKNVDNNGNNSRISVQLRYLIGCVSVIGDDGRVYQYPAPGTLSDSELKDLETFGYVFVAPFSSNEQALQSIVEGRQLNLATRNPFGEIQTRFKDIMQHAQTFARQESSHVGEPFLTVETANQVAKVLREQKILVDPSLLKETLRQSETAIQLSVDVLREELQEKVQFYQTSINAAHEQIKQESIENRETMQRDNEQHYERIWSKMKGNLREMEKRFEQLATQRLQEIDDELKEKAKQIFKQVEKANKQSLEAIALANQAEQISQQAVEQATKASNHAQDLVRSTEQRKQELQATANNCETTVKDAVAEQKDYYERMMSDMHTRFTDDIDEAKMAVQQSADKTKESAQIARQLKSDVQDIQKIAKGELDVQKKESVRIVAEAKEMRQQCDKAFQEAREAEKQAKRAADASTVAKEKVSNLSTQVEKTLERLQNSTSKVRTTPMLEDFGAF